MPPNIASIYDQLQSVDGEREALIGQLSAPTQPAVASNGTAIAAALPALIAGLFGGKSDLSAFAQGGSAALSAANEQAQQQQTREDMRKQLMLSLLDKKEGRLSTTINQQANRDFKAEEGQKNREARMASALLGRDNITVNSGGVEYTRPASPGDVELGVVGNPLARNFISKLEERGEVPTIGQLEVLQEKWKAVPNDVKKNYAMQPKILGDIRKLESAWEAVRNKPQAERAFKQVLVEAGFNAPEKFLQQTVDNMALMLAAAEQGRQLNQKELEAVRALFPSSWSSRGMGDVLVRNLSMGTELATKLLNDTYGIEDLEANERSRIIDEYNAAMENLSLITDGGRITNAGEAEKRFSTLQSIRAKFQQAEQ